jgi:phosphoribosylformimino-5-aminoimidazole carboxamide ribotide isomerase
VGGTLDTSSLNTNFTSEKPAAYFAELYRKNNLTGAHVVMLGPGCEEAAIAALEEWPGTVFQGEWVDVRWVADCWRNQ